MSGDRQPIVIAGDPGGKVGRLVDAAARLGTIGLGPWAVVGGLAVTCRLLSAHRVTEDVDTVTESTVPSALEVITRTVGAQDPTDQYRVTVDGVKVDVIDTVAVTAEQLEGVDGESRLFVLAHRWALDSAQPVTIRVQASSSTADAALATPAALVAAKTHALLSRRASRAEKHGSDTYDIYRLLDAHDSEGQVAQSLAGAPFGLGGLVADHLDRLLVENAERGVRWLRQGTQEMRAVTAADLRAVVGPFCEQLQ